MKSTITFGKYKGYTPEQLKRIDSNYLAWGANNLKSEKWVSEFQQALSTLTIEDEAEEMSRRDNISHDEAMNHLRSMIAHEAEEDEMLAQYESAKLAIAQEWAQVSGQPLAKIQAIIRKFEFGWDHVSERDFSSVRQYDLFVNYMTKINRI